jgi:hypothetical protein
MNNHSVIHDKYLVSVSFDDERKSYLLRLTSNIKFLLRTYINRAGHKKENIAEDQERIKGRVLFIIIDALSMSILLSLNKNFTIFFCVDIKEYILLVDNYI